VNLSREAIVETALEIMTAYGLADVSMRRLASALGVQPSALYWHFANKQELLAAVAGVVLADLPIVEPADWAAGLKRWASGLHVALRRRRGGAEVVSAVLALTAWEAGPGAAVEESLVAAGLAADQAHAAAVGLLYFVIGQAFDEEQRLQAAELGVPARQVVTAYQAVPAELAATISPSAAAESPVTPQIPVTAESIVAHGQQDSAAVVEQVVGLIVTGLLSQTN